MHRNLWQLLRPGRRIGAVSFGTCLDYLGPSCSAADLLWLPGPEKEQEGETSGSR